MERAGETHSAVCESIPEAPFPRRGEVDERTRELSGFLEVLKVTTQIIIILEKATEGKEINDF